VDDANAGGADLGAALGFIGSSWEGIAWLVIRVLASSKPTSDKPNATSNGSLHAQSEHFWS